MTTGALKKRSGGLSPKEEATRAQRLASSPDAPVWVGASAGSGKTKVLTDRVLRLLLKPAKPERILSITYTKTAAAEMGQRIAQVLAGWATLDDEKLKAGLAGLLGHMPDAVTIADARRLFARVVDTPGGMKIMTIHSFCQSVLKRFPIEAGLSPHFELVDDRTAWEYLLRAQHETVLAGGGAVFVVTARFNEGDLAEFIKSLTRRRRLLFDLVANTQDLRGDILEKLGLPRDANIAALLEKAKVVADRSGLMRAVEAMLVSSSKKDKEHGKMIADFLAGETALDDYAGAFIGRSTGKIFDTLAHGAAVKKFPGITEVLGYEAQRIFDLMQDMQMIEAADMTVALLTVGNAVLRRYEDLKTHHGQLDYDDLILKTAGLLSREGDRDWVLYKLDGGIDHILVDEAQDTSPEQWQVIDALTREFFAGSGARDEVLRTLFVVGDEKQSIFSFQGADPEEFKRRYLHFGQWLQNVELKVSFRSTEAVLSLVDSVFADAAVKEGVVFDVNRTVEHVSAREGHAGLIEVWPVMYPEKKPDPENWSMPEKPEDIGDAKARLAEKIADTIARWQKDGEILTARGRPIEPGDILVLVQRRNSFVEMLVRALKARDIPVAGVDRMVLTDQIAVMDMMALAAFCLLPADDLTLATLLKSPFIGMNEERLFDLCHGRERATLWSSVEKQEPKIAAWLGNLLRDAATQTPYSFFAGVLSRPCPADPTSGMRGFFGRLGPDCREAIEEFLNIALDFERLHPPSLQMFLNWFEKGQSEIKRDQEQGGGKIRIMTVHASKGLQAPIVFLPDTVFTPRDNAQKRDKIFWPDKNGEDHDPVLWMPPKAESGATRITAIKARLSQVRDREYRRLLYVALTRAADRLYVCGYGNSKSKAAEDCWHSCVARAFAPVAGSFEFTAGGTPVMDKEGAQAQAGLRLVASQEAAIANEKAEEKQDARHVVKPLPEWAGVFAKPEETPPRPLKPSAQADDEIPVRPPLGPDEGWRFARGKLIHRLLQTLPDLDVAQRDAAATRFLAVPANGLSPEQQQELKEEVFAVLNHPDFAPIFGAGSMAEVPVVSLLGKEDVLSGQIDRLCVTGNSVLIVDYKTNRPPPLDETSVAAQYLRQMALYRAAVRKIWPGLEVKCALLWTDAPRLMVLSGNLLDPYDP